MTDPDILVSQLLDAGRQLGLPVSCEEAFRGGDLVTWHASPSARFAISTAEQPLPHAVPDSECIAVVPAAQDGEQGLWRGLRSGEFGLWHTLTWDALADWLEQRSGETAPRETRPQQLAATVVENSAASALHHRLRLRCPEIARDAQPGQFLQVWCVSPEQVTEFEQHKNRELTGGPWPQAELMAGLPLLRRPMSIHHVSSSLGESPLAPLPRALRRRIERPCRDQLDLLIKLVGRGAHELSKRQPGEVVDIIGPLGKPVAIRPDLRHALVIAGGIGLAPLLHLTEELCWLGVSTQFLIGVRNREHLPLSRGKGHTGAGRSIEQLEAMGVKVTVVSEEEDGMMVTAYLAAHRAELFAECDEVFACGPKPMLMQVSKLIGDRVPCQVLLEERMACGVGACRSCVTKLRSTEPPGFILRTVCHDGPAFPASEVIWQ